VGDKVFLKVSPIKRVRRFNVRGKLSLKYIGPYEIMEKLNPLTYQLNLTTELEHVYNIFHISQLRKYVLHPNHVIEPEPIAIVENLTYEEHLVQILDCRLKQPRNKSIPPAKVL